MSRVVSNTKLVEAILVNTSSIEKACMSPIDAPSSATEIRDAGSMVQFIETRVRSVDRTVCPTAKLQTIHDKVVGANSFVLAFVAHQDVAHIAAATIELDAAVLECSFLPSVISALGEDVHAFAERAAEARRWLDSEIDSFNRKGATIHTNLEALSSEAQELQQSIENERNRLSSITSEYQDQFSKAQGKRLEDFATGERERQAEVAELAREFKEISKEKLDTFAELQQGASDDHRNQLADLKKQYDKTAGDIVTEIEEKRAEVEKLVGVIGNLGVTSGYLKEANQAQKTSRFWKQFTVASLIALAVIGLGTILLQLWGFAMPTGLEYLASRIFVAVTIGVLAAYAAVQADRNGALEKHNRRLALELEAIGPFLAPLPKDAQDQFRIEIGKRTFGKDESIAPDGLVKSPANVLDLAKSKELREFVVAILKAVKSE